MIKTRTGIVPIGTHGTILTVDYYFKWVNFEPRSLQYGYKVKFDGFDGHFGNLEDDLEPIYDGDQASSWEECAWKPKELEKA